MARTSSLRPQDEDLIVAIATPPGRGAIGIVRLSGPGALQLGELLCGRRLKPRRAHYCVLRKADGEILDQALALAFPGPNSFSGEDMVELQGHGGPAVLGRILQACLQQGARLARPGEFSERAWLNDRMDLAQAEATADLINADTEAAARAALQSLQGTFSRHVEEQMQQITRLRVQVEAAMDFPEEETELLADDRLARALCRLHDQLGTLRAEAARGALMAQGLNLIIAGAPNAGKSSLFNALAQRDAAIVSEIPGTTRDLLPVQVNLRGLPVRVTDTAGLRASDDPVEAEGMRRAWQGIAAADLVLYLVDLSRSQSLALLSDEISRFADQCERLIWVGNKRDLVAREKWPTGKIGEIPGACISALNGDGLDALTELILTAVGGGVAPGQCVYTARNRHLQALDTCMQRLAAASERCAVHAVDDLLAEELKGAHQALGEILGTMTADELLGEIFASFCIGK